MLSQEVIHKFRRVLTFRLRTSLFRYHRALLVKLPSSGFVAVGGILPSKPLTSFFQDFTDGEGKEEGETNSQNKLPTFAYSIIGYGKIFIKMRQKAALTPFPPPHSGIIEAPYAFDCPFEVFPFSGVFFPS